MRVTCRWHYLRVAGFDRTSLSPKLVEERPADLPFGLTLFDLGPAFRGRNVQLPRGSGWRVVTRYEVQGLHQRGRSRVVTLRDEAFDPFPEVDVFVKLATAREAEISANLAAAGAPIPSLLFDVPRSDSTHVLGFEFLDTIGIDFASAAEVTELLALIARLNACSPAILGLAANPPSGRPEAEFTDSVRYALAFVESVGLLEWATVAEVIDIYARAKRWAAAMPTAVTHGEMYFHQVGRRREGSLRMFDLATVGVRPRFSDLCSLVSGIARECALDEIDVIAGYLAQLALAGAPEPSVHEGLRELRRLRVLSCCQSLPWLVRSLDDPHLGLEAVADKVATMRRDLGDLGVLRSA